MARKTEPELRIRDACGDEHAMPLAGARLEVLAAASPWRAFRSHRDQRHFPGLYWSSTTGGHVGYESRLELARLLFADFDVAVHGIISQPFLLTAHVNGRPRRHVPDFLLVLADGGARVVNVKPAARLADPEVASALAWPEPLLGGCGLGYEVWSASDPVELANVRFLSGYRLADRFDRGLVERARVAAGGSGTIGEVVDGLSGVEREEALPVVLHLLWSGAVRADLSLPLELGSRLLGVR